MVGEQVGDCRFPKSTTQSGILLVATAVGKLTRIDVRGLAQIVALHPETSQPPCSPDTRP